MTLLLIICGGIACVAVGAIYSDALLALYDDTRELLRRIE